MKHNFMKGSGEYSRSVFCRYKTLVVDIEMVDGVNEANFLF